MSLRYGFLAVASTAVALDWVLTRIMETYGILTWWTWLLLGAGLVWAIRSRARDLSFVHGLVPGVLGTWIPIVFWWLFWDANLDLQYHLGLGLGFGLLVGGLAALSVALTKSTNPEA